MTELKYATKKRDFFQGIVDAFEKMHTDAVQITAYWDDCVQSIKTLEPRECKFDSHTFVECLRRLERGLDTTFRELHKKHIE